MTLHFGECVPGSIEAVWRVSRTSSDAHPSSTRSTSLHQKFISQGTRILNPLPHRELAETSVQPSAKSGGRHRLVQQTIRRLRRAEGNGHQPRTVVKANEMSATPPPLSAISPLKGNACSCGLSGPGPAPRLCASRSEASMRDDGPTEQTSEAS